jgi:putative heme iron utilization protein|tara:strand:+ start:1187 stop:1582 length:396 start_codon:yes stop_codon:yes gene_type:complete
MLKNILNDLASIDDVLFIVKRNGVVSEIRSNSLKVHQKEKWITIGDNNGPCHMHINSELLKYAEFVLEQKSDKISYSVRLFNENNERILDCFITKMYDMNKNLISSRKKLYDDLFEKYGSRKILNFKNNEH